MAERRGLVRHLIPILVALLVLGGALLPSGVFAQHGNEAGVEDDEPTPTPLPYRTLLPFELNAHAIALTRDEAQALSKTAFSRAVGMLQNEQPIEALNETLLMIIRQPGLSRMRPIQLLLAECFYTLGSEDPAPQFRYSQPIYEELMRLFPRWDNQPLVLFRLATIYERKGLTIEALAAYGLLVDWYPDDPLAESGRLGLLMTALRNGELADAEGQAEMVLQTAKDAQIRHHAAVCLAVARHRQGRSAEALADFEKTIRWPDELETLEDFELFALGEVYLKNQKYAEETQAFMTYLKRFPFGSDRPLAVLYLAEEAQRIGQIDEAVLGYRFLIERYPLHYAGVRSKLQLASLLMTAQPGKADEPTEQLLRQVRDQNDYHDMAQKAGLKLAEYLICVGRSLEAMDEVTDVIKYPIVRADAEAATQLMLQAFQNVLAANRANPMLVAVAFRKYRDFLDVPSAPRAMYAELGAALNQNLQADTLLAISGNNPLAKAHPRVASYLTAEGRRLRGEYDLAKSALGRLLDMAAAPEDAGDGLAFAARLLWAQIECDQGNPREALRVLGLAQPMARDDRERALIDLEAGKLLLQVRTPEAAAERLANAVRGLGLLSADEPLRSQQLDAAFNLGEALFESNRYAEALAVFAEFVKADPRGERTYLARARIVQAQQALGQPIAPLAEVTTTPAWFWPRVEWSVETFYSWLQNNQTRFGEMPDWEKLP